MAFDRFSTYITFGGPLGTAPGEDFWQCGVKLANTVPLVIPSFPTTAQLTEVHDLIDDYIADPDTGVCNGAGHSFTKAAALDLAGDYTTAPVLVETAPLFGGGGNPNGNPPQSALAVTLWSGSTFGQANYGRYYLPWANLTVFGTTGKMVGAGSVATRSAAFISALNDLVAGWAGTEDAVVSIMSSVGSGTTKAAQFVRVGDVKDTQRRRRNAIEETYSQQAI